MHISISLEEVLQLVRERYDLPANVEIRVDATSPSVPEAGEWVKVPTDWRHCYAPDPCNKMRLIEVKRRYGGTVIGTPESWKDSWAQLGYVSDIVAYREVK